MRGQWSRRRVLGTLGASTLGSLAGCADADGPEPLADVTPAPVPTDPRRPPVRTSTARSLSGEAIRFDVSIDAPFDEAGPARLAVGVRNASETPLTAIAESPFVFPFVDDDYAGSDLAGDPRLFLVPDDAALVVRSGDRSGEPVEPLLPDRPVDGCWSVPFDGRPPVGPTNAALRSVTLAPDEARRHGYRVYFLDGCSPGRYSFQSSFLLAAGASPGERGTYRALTGFHVGVTGQQGLLLGTEDPVLSPIATPTER